MSDSRLSQLLGLCPLLVVTTTLTGGLALGLATLLVLCVAGTFASLGGAWLPHEGRAAILFVVVAAAIAATELAMAGWFPGLHATLGMSVPLIASPCLLLACEVTRTTGDQGPRALLDAVGVGGTCLLLLVAVGSLRELLGGPLLATLPAGAFLLLALLLAAWNAVHTRRSGRSDAAPGHA